MSRFKFPRSLCTALFIGAMSCASVVVQAGPSSYASAVAKASPSVVNIYTKRMVDARASMLRQFRVNPSLQDMLRGMSQQGQQKAEQGMGSGVIVSKNGYILTNAHVVQGASNIEVALSDGRTTQARIIGTDPGSDLAVLKVNMKNLHPIPIGNSDNLRVGDVVLAIGNPFGLNQTVTQGIVSATGRQSLGINQFENFIQTDAAINPGNSGGALVTAKGKLIGINSVIYSQSGGNNGIGFAVPINLAENIMHQLINKGKVSRGWLGVQIQNIDLKRARNFGYKYNGGVGVVSVMPDSPASKYGIERGDIVLSLNGKSVKNSAAFFKRVASIKPTQTARFVVLRNGREKNVNVKIGERPAAPAHVKNNRQGSMDQYRHYFGR